MKLLRAVELIGQARPSQPGIITGQPGTDRAACQQGDQHIHLFEGGGDALHPHHGDMGGGQGGTHPGIPLVGYQADRSRFGDGEVAAGDADLGAEEILADLLADEQRHGLRGLRPVVTQRLMQYSPDLITILVDRGYHHMRGRILIELENILTEIGFHDLNTRLL